MALKFSQILGRFDKYFDNFFLPELLYVRQLKMQLKDVSVNFARILYILWDSFHKNHKSNGTKPRNNSCLLLQKDIWMLSTTGYRSINPDLDLGFGHFFLVLAHVSNAPNK